MSEHSKPTQNERIVQYIEDYGSITQLEAIRDLGVMRLASRVSDLRKQGVPIVSSYEKVKNRYGEETQIKRYSFAKEKGELESAVLAQNRSANITRTNTQTKSATQCL